MLHFVTRRAAGLGTDARPCVCAVSIFRPQSSSASRSTVSHAVIQEPMTVVKAECIAVQTKVDTGENV